MILLLNNEQMNLIKEETAKLLSNNTAIRDNILAVEDIRNKLAVAITTFAFRNGPIEYMHADSNKNITDEDMMILNKHMVDKMDLILQLLSENDCTDIFIFSLLSELYGANWDKPNPDQYREELDSCIKLSLLIGAPAFLKRHNTKS